MIGLAVCARYSYPPNSLYLCGPTKQKNLQWYSATGNSDIGTLEILSQFTTLYPYLTLIAYENGINNPFALKVVEAYWLGNSLLFSVSISQFARHVKDSLRLKHKLPYKEVNQVITKIGKKALPHHAFHVLNIWRRTGHCDCLHTIETMDACLVNWGRVTAKYNGYLLIETRPLTIMEGKLTFARTVTRKILVQGSKDMVVQDIQIGDWISYHWGYVCQKLTLKQLQNLIYYTKYSLSFANQNRW